MQKPTLALWAIGALLMASTAAFAEEANKPADPLEGCQAQAGFLYHVDMMNIEGQEMRAEISHDMADMQKSRRHMNYMGALAVCKDEHGKK